MSNEAQMREQQFAEFWKDYDRPGFLGNGETKRIAKIAFFAALASLPGLPEGGTKPNGSYPALADASHDARKELSRLVAISERETHLDDLAVDKFAAAMKQKMAISRAKGRSGWDDPDECDTLLLWDLLRGHIEKGDPTDIANFCMMIWMRTLAATNGTTVRALIAKLPHIVKEATNEH